MSTGTDRRPDASMTLIREMMERPLDPGYAAEAARRQRAGLPASTGLHSPRLAIMGLACGLLFSVAAITLNRDRPAIANARSTLISQITAARTSADKRSVQVGTLQSEIAVAETRHGEDLAGRLSALEAATGALAVEGPGLVITVDDAPGASGTNADGNPRTGGAVPGGTVQSRDIQIITNALWQAGAEAIMINGQRLSSRSAIRFAGEAILVNFRPLSRPYTVSAIGDPATLPANFAESTGGSYLEALKSNFGIKVSTSSQKAITMPGATALTTSDARPVLPVQPAGTSPSVTPRGGSS
ncbi:MAG: DUF881 domain-containing protein [Nostocoides sp.]